MLKKSTDGYKVFLVVLLAFFGIYMPTSVMQISLTELQIFAQLIGFLTIIGLFLLQTNKVSYQSIYSGLLLFFPFLFTLLSPINQVAWGSISGFVILSLLINLDIKDIDLGIYGEICLNTITLISGFMAVGVLMKDQSINEIIVANYSAFYPELVRDLIYDYVKPVGTFASHSIASFMYYLMFILHFIKYINKFHFVNLMFLLLLFYINLSLYSVTSLATSLIMIVMLLQLNISNTFPFSNILNKKNVKYSLILFGTFYIFQIQAIDIIQILMSEGNGINGRYSTTATVLSSTTNYISQNLFSPLGFKYTDQVFFGDSGYIEYFLRGSIFMLLSVYIGLYAFVFRNTKPIDKNNSSFNFSLFVYLSILAFEIGYTITNYYRFQFFLPFFICYLNTVSRSKKIIS